MLVSQARQGDQNAKRQLLQCNYSAALANPDGSPLKGIVQPGNSVGMDVDFPASDPMLDEHLAEARERILAKKDELGLLMLERSATKGFHVVFRRRAELSQVGNLEWASQLLGVPYDDAAKDVTRVFFTTTDSDEDLIYLSPELFDTTPLAIVQQSRVEPTQSAAEPTPESAEELTYRGYAMSEIVDTYWELFEGGNQPSEGDRNVKTFELAKVIRHICNYDLRQLERAIPRYDNFPVAEWRQTLQNALEQPRTGVPLRLQQVMNALAQKHRAQALGGNMETPPEMPKRLPSVLKLLTSKVPDIYKPCVAEGVFPALAAHLHGVRFRYIDNIEHEATLMNLLIAPQSSGKGRIKDPINCIMADINERDQASRLREMEWKQKNPQSRTKRDPRPSDICIQFLSNNLTNAAFSQRVIDAHNNGEVYLYSRFDELEGVRKVTSSGRFSDVTEVMRMAFDNAMFGQERVGADSITGVAPLRWNFNISTTLPNAERGLRSSVNDGTLSRLSLSTIVVPERQPGERNHVPVVGEYDEEFRCRLAPYIERLWSANGQVVCKRAHRFMCRLEEELDNQAALCDSDAFRTLSYRALVIGFLKGMVLYIAEGEKWNKQIEEYVRWSVLYDLWCKMRFFGNQLEEQIISEHRIAGHGPQDLLAMLPDNFGETEYQQMRLTMGKQGDGKKTIRTWKHRGYIVWDDTCNCWYKTELYLSRQAA